MRNCALPLVSVVIPMYNREKVIKRSIDSVLQQTVHDFEIIVVDDCSTDGSCAIVAGYNDCRIKLIKNSKNHGANYCRNIGIQESSGRFIAFQDSDDEWECNKLEVQIGYMLEKGVKASFSPYIVLENNRIIPENYEELADNSVLVRDILRKYNIIGTPTLIIDKEITNRVGLFDESMPRLQDYEYAIRIAKNYDICCCPFILLRVYTDEVRITSNREKLDVAISIILQKHLDFINFQDFFATRYFLLNEGNIFNGKVFKEMMDNKTLNEFAINYLKKENEQQLERNKIVLDINTRRLIDKHFLIYGAGKYAKALYADLKTKNKKPKYFIVTDKKMNDERIDSIEVLNVNDVIDKNMTVIVAVAPLTQNEILNFLEQKGFSDVLTV